MAETKRIRLVEIAHCRSGDKGNRADLGLFAYKPEYYDLLVKEVTPERVRAHFAPLMTTEEVEYYPMPNLNALKFVLNGALGGGASQSLRSDNLGKTMGAAMLRMEIDVPADLIIDVSQTK